MFISNIGLKTFVQRLLSNLRLWLEDPILHPQRALEMVGDHARLTDVVRMHVRANHALNGLSRKVCAEDVVPQISGLFVIQSSIDDVPAVDVF